MIYLASPYNHHNPAIREMRFSQAVRETVALMREGKLVYSPIAYSHQFAANHGFQGGWEYWKRLDLEMVNACDEVVVLMLPGWEDSVGVKAEIEHAKRFPHKKVTYRTPTES